MEDFLGRGWAFPPSFDRARAEVAMAEGTDDIDQSLHILLSTTVGERIMVPAYGCNLHRYVFEPANESVQFRIKKLVEDAILYFEPRILLHGVDLTVEDEEGRIDIGIEYVVKENHSRGNYVFPLYLGDEGRSP